MVETAEVEIKVIMVQFPCIYCLNVRPLVYLSSDAYPLVQLHEQLEPSHKPFPAVSKTQIEQWSSLYLKMS